MNKGIVSTASLSAMALAMAGAMNTGRAGQQAARVVEAAAARGVARAKAESKHATAPGSTTEDPAVTAERLAGQEADVTLRTKICEFIGKYGSEDWDLETAQQNGAKPNNTYCQDASLDAEVSKRVLPMFRPKVMLAVLPNPVHTQLALRFDESADEVQNSMQDLGWLYDRAWLPWETKDREEAVDFDERQANEAGQAAYEKAPGVLLFRGNSNGEPAQPAIVLVVGDTPTGGVDAEQFRKAVTIWQQLTGWQNCYGPDAAKACARVGVLGNVIVPDASRLEVLGPTYSGSLPSLNALLDEVVLQLGRPASVDNCRTQSFDALVVSGTVSSRAAMSPQAYCSGKTRVTLTMSSMAVDLGYEYQRVLRFLKTHLPESKFRGERVALLSEAESSYGDFFTSNNSVHAQAAIDYFNRLISTATTEARKNFYEGLKKTAMKGLEEAQRTEGLAPHHYYFPREISKLRAAYEQNNIFGFASGAGSVKTQLHLSLSGSDHDDDTVHTFSGTQGAATMEASMAQLASELERTHVTVAVISATDVLDEIFVTRYLAQHAPNVAVVVTDVDGLFLRDDESSMQNVYVVGPWPLIPGNAEWSSPASKGSTTGSNRIHASGGAQGLYAAVRYLVCKPDSSVMQTCGGTYAPKGMPTLAMSLPEYQPPVATWAAKDSSLQSRPPLWLSVVGHGGFWPVALVDVDQAGEGLSAPPENSLPNLMQPDARSGKVPPGLNDAQGIFELTSRSVVILTGLVALFLAVHGMRVRARLDRGFAWSYALSDPRHHLTRMVLQMTITMAVVPVLVLLKTPIEAGVNIRTPAYTGLNWMLQVVAVVMAGWPVWRALGGWPVKVAPSARPTKDNIARRLKVFQARRGRFFGGMAAWVVVGPVFLWACNRWLWGAIAPSVNSFPTERAFFFYRSGHLFSGSSPVLPVLLLGAALLLFVLSVFERLVFYNHRIPKFPKAEATMYCPCEDKVKPLNSLLAKVWSPYRVAVLGAVAVVMMLFVTVLHEMVPRSLTHGRFDVVVVMLAAVVMLLLLYDTGTALLAWVMLRGDCLLPLSRSPLRWGFTWIKGWSWKRIWTPGAVSPDRVLDYLRRLAEANRRSGGDTVLDQAFIAARRQMERKRRDAKWAGRVTFTMGKLHRELARVATGKLTALHLLYQHDHGPITGSDEVARGLSAEIPLEKREPEASPAQRQEWTDAQDRVAMEEFVAMLYLGYIRMVLLQIRNRIMTATGMYMLLLWAMTSYPYLNHHAIVLGLTCLLALLAAVIVVVYSQMHRDDILSRTTQTTSGKLDADFFTKVLGMVGLPLVSLIASQFPEVSNVVFSWLEPGLSSMK